MDAFLLERDCIAPKTPSSQESCVQRRDTSAESNTEIAGIMRAHLKLARIFGIELSLHCSRLLVARLIFFLLYQNQARSEETYSGDPVLGRYSANERDQIGGRMKFTSPSFSPGGSIPKQFTCEGQNISPALSWTGAPKETKSF